MNVDRCRATVFLHEPLRQSLATWLGGTEVASMQRCALDGGHRGEHVGLPDADGKGSFRWDECGVHIGSGTSTTRPVTTPTTARPPGGRHAAEAHPSGEPDKRSSTQALWALTAAVERLAESISAVNDRGALDHRATCGTARPPPPARAPQRW